MYDLSGYSQREELVMEIRFEERRNASIPIEVISFKNKSCPISMTTRNMSPRGAYIESALSYAMGDHLICKFKLPKSNKSFSFIAEVERVDNYWREGNLVKEGFGVSFIDTRAHERLTIRSYLRQSSVADSSVENQWFR